MHTPEQEQRPADAPDHPTGPAPGRAIIGPNAIIQTVGALQDRYGADEAAALLARGGKPGLAEHLPTAMIDEQEFHTLVCLLDAAIGPAATTEILQEAGRRTGRYVLTHRLPQPVQRLIRLLPRRIGLRLLLQAMSFNAWTFIGSGTFRFQAELWHPQPTISVRVVCPSAPTVAGFYGGTFACLLQELIGPQTTVQTSTNQHTDGIDCTYTLTLDARTRTASLS